MEQHGPDAPLELIAERAGVTRRTVYRWVDTRDDLVFVHPVLWLDTFGEAVDAVPDLGLDGRIRTGARAVCTRIDADPDPVLRAMRLAMAHPQLFRGYAGVTQRWIDRMAEEVMRSGDHDRFRSRVLGSAIMGVIDAALFEWSGAQPTPQLWPLVDAGLDLLGPILD